MFRVSGFRFGGKGVGLKLYEKGEAVLDPPLSCLGTHSGTSASGFTAITPNAARSASEELHTGARAQNPGAGAHK